MERGQGKGKDYLEQIYGKIIGKVLNRKRMSGQLEKGDSGPRKFDFETIKSY